MEKIVIIGSSGAGKSTLARQLGKLLNINRVVHLDRLFWQPGWKQKPGDIRVDILQRLVCEQQWIIEGSYLSSSDARLNAADTIIFLDMPPCLCLWRIFIRHWRYRESSRRDIPDGCTDRLSLSMILKVLSFPLSGRRKLEKKLAAFPAEKVVRLRSRKAVESFLERIVAQSDQSQSTRMSTVMKERRLVLAGR